ncbi:HNH endonuclease [Nannocystaceae bacterium ST9]
MFDDYAHARPHLVRHLGDYCSFCEIQLSAALAVEHIRCKDTNPDLECEWDNFLLACPSCNSTKGTKVDTEEDVDLHVWPHRQRTFDAFVYEVGGVVRVAEITNPELAERARATEALVGLGKRPGEGLTRDQILRGSDRRYQKRSEAWDEAIEARNDLLEFDTPAVRKHIVRSALARGFWSVWMTVFRDIEWMQAELCEVFPGTAKDRVFPLPAHLQS